MSDPFDGDEWNFPFEKHLHEVAPGVHEAQNWWMSSVEAFPSARRGVLWRLSRAR